VAAVAHDDVDDEAPRQPGFDLALAGIFIGPRLEVLAIGEPAW
jgi:hypothetical protein